MKKYKFIACGGTFDLFHKGHREFLRFALAQGETVLIGITSDSYKDSKREMVASYEERKEYVVSFLEKEKALDRVKISPIHDMYGPLLESSSIDLLVVSEETVGGAAEINKEREKKGLQKLDVLVFSSVRAEDGQIISSSRIRQGEIDREGKLYIRPEWLIHALYLPESVRIELKQPVGTLVKQGSEYMKSLNGKQTVTVGDVVTKTCNNKSFNQVISIVDFVVQREKQYISVEELGFSGNEEVLTVINPAGFITPQLFQAVQKVFREINKNPRFVICVDGEEDLAVLPVLLVAPLGFVVLYGQPHEGVVQIFVTEESKNKARYFVSKFNS